MPVNVSHYHVLKAFRKKY